MLHRSIRRYAFAALVSCAALPFAAQAGALTDILMAKLAVTQPQADGGAGSIFKLARAQMTPENFQKLNAVVPGMSAYLGAAPAFLPGEQTAGAALPGAGLAQGATVAGVAGGGASVGALAAAAGGRSTAGNLAAAAAGGSPASGLAAAAGGGSASGALAAAALGQPVSPADALKGAARNKLAATVGGAVPAAPGGLAGVAAAAAPGAQGGLAGVAAGALAGNAGGVSTGGAAGALLAGTALGDKLQAAQALAPAFSQLGLNQTSVAQFLPIVIGYVKSVGGKSSSKLLTQALGL
ncbi:MAG: DUF2780 domain-containing protein [Gammaproteobacteria bacterium]|nr:DUF2780 domain-containing protein [Gammaproteobacteria bacterium]